MTKDEIGLREQRYCSYIFAKIEMKYKLAALYPEYVSEESAAKYEQEQHIKLAHRLHRFGLVLCLQGLGSPCIVQRRLTLEDPETRYAIGFGGFR